MSVRVLVAHAPAEEERAEELAIPLRTAGFDVAHRGTVLVGSSVVGEASKVLSAGGPVVLCGTIRALGTRWARQVVLAARESGCRVFCVRMEEEADVEAVSFDEQVADYWRDPERATAELVAALRAAYPADEDAARLVGEAAAEARYRQLALQSCDIVDLAQLPEADRHVATRTLELRRLYVPLNIVVEPRTGVEGSGEDALHTLERRRLALKGWRAGFDPDTSGTRERAPLGERLAASRRLVVLGDPGAGKTTLLRWLATAYLLRLKGDPAHAQLPAVETLPEADWLPIVVRCRDLTAECASGALDDVLDHTLRKAELAPDEADALRRLLRRRLEEGSAILLVDGLDEITDPGLRARFAQQLEQVHVAFPRAPVVVTSRIVGYRDMGYRIGRGFEHLTVADFTPEEKDDFARRWCALTELPERVEPATAELIADIHSTDRVERLTGNPMLLTTMALVKRKIGRLPSRRADLYWEALQVLLNWRREVDRPLDHRETVPQLEYVAYAMCARGVQQLREDEVLELLDALRGEYPRLYDVHRQTSREFLCAMEARTGILVRAGFVRHGGRPMPLYEFRHLTFQEYLAGMALVDHVYPGRAPDESSADAVGRIASEVDEIDRSYDRELVTRESWREAIRVAVMNAKHDEADAVLRAVLGQVEGPDASIRARAVLATFCLADDPEVGAPAAGEVLLRLVRVIDGSDCSFRTDTTLHEAVVEAMGSRWRVALQDALLDAFVTREQNEREPLGYVLGLALAEIEGWARFTSSDSLHAIRTDDRTAISAFVAAAGCADRSSITDRAMEPLVELALSAEDRSPPVVHATLIFLQRASVFMQRYSDRIGVWLRRYWDEDGWRDLGLGLIAAYELREFQPDAEAELDSSAPHRRLLAAWALQCSADGRAVEPLVKRLEDESTDVRHAAADALGSIGGAQAVQPLVGRLEDEAAYVRCGAAGALGKIGDAHAVGALVMRLEDEDAEVRSAAAEALGEIGDASALEALVAGLEDEDAEVRSAAAEALGEIGDASALEALVAGLEDEDAGVRSAAADALGKFGDPHAVEALVVSLEDEHVMVRSAAADALGRIGDAHAVEALVIRLKDEDALVRADAAHALGMIGDAHAVEALVMRLEDEDADVRFAAVDALGEIGDASAVQPLVKCLNNEHAAFRSIAADALGKIGDLRAVQHLNDRLSSDDQVRPRIAAAAALARLGEGCRIEQLRTWLYEPDPELRRGAVEVLSVNAEDPDRRLLTSELHQPWPFLDPQEPITEQRVEHAATALNLPAAAIRARYRALAPEFGLVLEFADEPAAADADPATTGT